jgi:hypothetical protein
MAKKRLTDRTLKALKPTGSRYDVMDADVPGFGVRVSETGQRTFILIARYPGSSNPTRRALGEYPAISLEKAREKARDWRDVLSARGLIQRPRKSVSGVRSYVNMRPPLRPSLTTSWSAT